MTATGARFTFRANRDLGRHGWLRLTPAYSVGLVQELAAGLGAEDHVLDPFCGTGTTALVCAERGIACDTLDINPFLIWLATVKCARYSESDVEEARSLVERTCRAEPRDFDWTPPISKVERWWDAATLAGLAAVWRTIQESEAGEPARNLAKVAFCRTMMGASRASFGHQSLSFKRDISQETSTSNQAQLQAAMRRAFEPVDAAALDAPGGFVRVISADARQLDRLELEDDFEAKTRYSAVITSPPYPNRMSYVRELRPYLFWLGYLAGGREAGLLDWEAIGGTWGIATSKLVRWTGKGTAEGLISAGAIEAIRAKSLVLANYVLKYIEDMVAHISTLRSVLRPNGRATYVVGNSHFYGVPVETQQIFAALFEHAGFSSIDVRTLRKRTSKTGLFEYAVSATGPA